MPTEKADDAGLVCNSVDIFYIPEPSLSQVMFGFVYVRLVVPKVVPKLVRHICTRQSGTAPS